LFKEEIGIGKCRGGKFKESEIPIVQQLIEALDLSGVIFTLDALHCQKNNR
jgi:predicted transposase YbfD/YdcC